MKLNTVLTTVLKNLGLDTTSEDVQKLLGNESLAAIDVADTVSSKMTAEYFTKEAALQNAEIRSKIKAETLNGIDAQTKELMALYEFDTDTQSEILAEEKSSKRISKMVDKVAELTKAKSKVGAADKDVLNKEIEKLNAAIASTKIDYEKRLADEQKARKTDRVNWELDSIYNGLDYSMQSEKEISVGAAKSVMNSIAAKKGLRFDTTENGVQILTAEGTEYYDNNVKVTPQDFIKKTLMENKLLKVSDTATPGTQSAQQSGPTASRGSIFQPAKTSFDDAIKGMINELPKDN